jgi:Putative adhesin
MRRLLILPLLAFPILADGSFERTFHVGGSVDLDVETHAGAIAVHAGDASSVKIHATLRPNHNSAAADTDQAIRAVESNPPVIQAGNTIRITRIADEELRRKISISYEITMPAAGKLRARTGSGRLSVQGIQGPVDASSGSGSIALESIGGKVDVHTGSGSIRAKSVTGPSVLRTGSGSVTLDQTTAGAVKASTGSGSVTIRLPNSGGFDLHARTGSGRVYLDQPNTITGDRKNHEFKGQVRGGGPLVEVTTGSGSIRVGNSWPTI